MTKTYSSSPNSLEQAIAHNLLVVNAESSLRDVMQLINQAHQEQPIEEAKLSRSCILCVLVMAESQLVGILSQSDLLRLMVMDLDTSKIKISTVMNRPVVTMPRSEFQDVATPLNLLRQHQLSYLPLLDEHNYPIGLVTLKGLLEIDELTVRSPQSTPRERIENESLLTAIANRIQASLDLQTILDATVTEIRQFLNTDRVIAYRFEPDWSGIVVAESVQSQWNSLLGRTITDPHFVEHMVEPYRNGRIQVTDNVYLGGLTWCHMNLLIEIQVKAIIVVPILEGNKLWGLLAAQECAQPRHWEPTTVELLQQLGTHIGIAIQQASTIARIKQLNQQLKGRISEKTAALATTEQNLHLIVSNISDGILILDYEGRIMFANPSAARIFGIPIEQLMGLLIGVPIDNRFEISHLINYQTIGGSELEIVSIEWNHQPAYLISLRDITQRQQAEEKLLKSQSDLAAAQQIAHVGSWELDIATQTVFLSEELYRIFRLEPNQQQLTYEQLRHYIAHGDWKILNRLVSRAIEFGESYKVDLRIIRADGSTGYILAKGNPRRNARGKISAVFGIAMDISDRKADESLLRRYERVVAATADGIILYDRNYTCQLVNQVYLNWHQKQLEEIIGHSADEILGENDFQTKSQPFLDLCLAGEIQHYEDWFDYQDGNRRFVRVTYSPYVELDQTITGVVAILHELTPLKKIEEALRKSEERLRRYFDQPLLGMAISAPDKRWLDVNDCFCKMLGYSRAEMLQKNWAEMTHPDDLQANVDYFNQVLAGKIEGYVLDKRFLHKNGDSLHTTISAQCFRNFDMTVNSFVVMVQDISDRKQYEQQLERTNAELLRATRLKDEFLANMSHELRTPLNAILGMAEGMQEEVFGAINERQRKALQTVERSGSHLLELINDILDVAKIEAGQIELDYTSVAVTQLCQSSFTFVRQQALKKHIQLELKLPPHLPDLLVDERRILQVLINLLNNAVKFTPEGGHIILEATHIPCNPNTPQDHLQISVTDTGIGISPENIQKLFQPFIQIDSALNRQYEGTGLGLSLVKRIVELHGGKVGLTSELGVGSCFTIELPYTTSSPLPLPIVEDDPLHPQNPDFSPADPVPHKAPLILLAEDNEANINTVSSYLGAKGYRIVVANNGQEAIALAKADQPDLILMDIQMPVMDGLEATRQIRLDPALVEIPIIAMTALAMTGDRDRCLAAGANEYLSKPVRLKQLTSIIQNFLSSG